MKAKFNSKGNIEIELESDQELDMLGCKDTEIGLENIPLVVVPTEDASRIPFEVTRSHYPIGVFVIVDETGETLSDKLERIRQSEEYKEEREQLKESLSES